LGGLELVCARNSAVSLALQLSPRLSPTADSVCWQQLLPPPRYPCCLLVALVPRARHRISRGPKKKRSYGIFVLVRLPMCHVRIR
jgi:hypothetical protein